MPDFVRERVDIAARFRADKTMNSYRLGKPVPGRGVEVIDRITEAADDVVRRPQLTLLDDLCTTMTKGSLCAMGGLTPMPVRSALRHWPKDFGLTEEAIR